jgi:hypothetical protein
MIFKLPIKHFLIIVAMFFSSCIYIVFLFWWVYPYKTIELNKPYRIINEVIKAGDILYYEVDYCKFTEASGRIDRQFIDGLIYTMPGVIATLPCGCHKFIQGITVPENLPPATYHLRVYSSYEVNPIRTITNQFDSETFIITE